jgi:2-dehydro-3-deoxyphosphooctonate aldolase (KDO 8-P synthase)
MIVIAGPCVIEGDVTIEIAKILKENLHPEIDFYFKASFKKANRTRIDGFMGIPDGISVLEKIKTDLGLRICTDVHEVSDVDLVKHVVDIIQIPAFLCRQTDLIYSAGLTGKIVNIKKGQFMSPESMKWSAQKASWSNNVWITERGNSFGYTDLIVDSTSIPRIKKSTGCPAILDVTHSLQKPNHSDGVTMGSDKSLSRILMRQAAVSGADGIFMEVHTKPQESKSDTETILPIYEAIEWANEAYRINRFVKENFSIDR